jgi:hypothetical protein
VNINDVLIRVLKKDGQTSEQIANRNEEEKHDLEITAREARDREIAENFQELEQLKQVEINRQAEDEQWHCDELKKIEEEEKYRKSELDRLRAAARELEEAKRLKKAEEEEIAQLKRLRASAAKENNRRSNNIQARSNVKKSSRQEDEVVEEENEEWEEEEERPVRRSSKPEVRRDSPMSAMVTGRMPRRKPSTATFCFQGSEDDHTDASEDSEDDYAPPPPKFKRPSGKRSHGRHGSTPLRFQHMRSTVTVVEDDMVNIRM